MTAAGAAPVKGTEPSHTGDRGIFNRYERVASAHHADGKGGGSRFCLSIEDDAPAFIYCPKPSRAERDRNRRSLPCARHAHIENRHCDHARLATAGRIDVLSVTRTRLGVHGNRVGPLNVARLFTGI
jgi:hypothetical protein